MLLNIRTGDVPLLIRKTAEEVTGAFYEMNRSDKFRQYAGAQRRFVRQCWKDHVQTAIDLLTQMLAMPGTSDHVKDEIYDALIEFKERSQQGTPALSTRSLQ